MRFIVRGFVNGEKRFEDTFNTMNSDDLEKHAQRRLGELIDASPGSHMIELEFLDAPDPATRFLRFGSDPSGMVDPHRVDLAQLRRRPS